MTSTANFKHRPTAIEIKIEAAIQTALTEIPDAPIEDLLDCIDSIVSYPVHAEADIRNRIAEIR